MKTLPPRSSTPTGEKHLTPESVRTDDLDISNASFVSVGDFIGIKSASYARRDCATTSTGYDQDTSQMQYRIRWGDIIPDQAQGANSLDARILPGTDETVDVRVLNAADNETMLEQTGISAPENITIGPAPYTPTTTSNQINIVVQLRTNPGVNSSVLREPQLTTGIQL